MDNQNYVIGIARGFGSGGKEVASRVAKSLGIHCYENRILTMASQMTGIDESEYVNADERLKDGYLVSKIRELPRSLHFIPVDRKFTSNESLFAQQVKIMHQLVEEEPCVIVGKCADYVFRDYTRSVFVYIEASRASCVERTMAKMNVDEAEANRIISTTDKYRADYYKYYTNGGYWTNPINYDMTLNVDRVGIDGCVDLITEYTRKKLQL